MPPTRIAGIALAVVLAAWIAIERVDLPDPYRRWARLLNAVFLVVLAAAVAYGVTR